MIMLDDIMDMPVSSWGKLLHPMNAKTLRNNARMARPFVFDREASLKLGAFIRDCPDILADNLEFAKIPFPETYIEVDNAAVHEAIGDIPLIDGDSADWKIGFLATEKTIHTLGNSKENIRPAVGLISYVDSNAEAPKSDFLHGTKKRRLDMLLWNSTEHMTVEQQDKFIERFWYGMSSDASDLSAEVVSAMASAQYGEIRIFVAALLFLHQKRHISIGERPWERKISKGKSRVFMAHSVVTINIDGPVEMRRSFSITNRESPRAHEVAGHYKHRHGDTGCEHQWTPVLGNDHQWVCDVCGRLRYLVKSHMRGDASKGYVRKTYEVTAQEEKK